MKNSTNVPVIYARFFGWGGPPNVWGGPIFEGRNEMFQFEKALKFGVIFQKYSLKLKKIEKNWENSREMQFFPKFFWFSGTMGKISIIWAGYIGGSGAEPPS